MDKSFSRFLFDETDDISKSIRFENIFSEEYRRHMFYDVHPLHFCARYVNTNELDTLHTHPYIQIWYVKSGSYRLFFKDHELYLNKGSLVIVPPNCPHYIDSRGDSVLIRCEFSEDFIMTTDNAEFHDAFFNLIYLEATLIATNEIEPYCHFPNEVAAEIEMIFDELCNEFSKMDKFSEWLVRANLIRLLAIIGRARNSRTSNEKISSLRESLDGAIKYINENFSEKLYLKEICQKAMMDRTTFSYLFKSLMRMSFTEYLRYFRVLQAQKFLTETDRTQADIAAACGFHSVSFLHKTFKQYTGLLPGEYRRNMKKREKITSGFPEDTDA